MLSACWMLALIRPARAAHSPIGSPGWAGRPAVPLVLGVLAGRAPMGRVTRPGPLVLSTSWAASTRQVSRAGLLAATCAGLAAPSPLARRPRLSTHSAAAAAGPGCASGKAVESRDARAELTPLDHEFTMDGWINDGRTNSGQKLRSCGAPTAS